MEMYKIRTPVIAKNMANGIVRFGFLISPLLLIGVSTPRNAKIKIREALPVSPIVGVDVQRKFSDDTYPIPTKVKKIRGISLAKVAASINLGVVLSTLMLRKK